MLLGSRFADLERFGTRWRAVVTRWATDPRVRRLTVVDFPRFGRRLSCEEQGSWLPGVRALGLAVPGPVGGSAADDLGWALAARALRARLGSAPDRVVVAANPLSVPLLSRLRARRTGFDAVDDWRALPSVAAAGRRLEAGYRAARSAHRVTAVSDVLTARLGTDFGLVATTVGNGVAAPPSGPPVDAPDGLPHCPFALYVGRVQERVDLDLLGAVARAVPVVVAGPADARHEARLRALPLTWLGPVPVGQVPALVSRAAVGLLPHRRDLLTESMAPMKLLEYVAAGLPTVSTPLPGVAGHPGVVVADDEGAFVAAVRQAMAAGRVSVPASWLADHDWDAVADRLLRLHVLGEP